MASELFSPTARATDANGNPYSGATWTFYATGTSTPQNVYSNATLVTSLGSTVTADSGGKFVPIYFDSSLTYRGVCKDSTGTITLHDIDPINDPSSYQLSANLAASSGSSLIGFIQSGTGAAARTVQAKARDIVSVKDFGAVGDGITDDTTAINNALAAHKCVYIPKGTYKITGTLSVTLDGAKIYGDGINSTILTSTSTTLPMISIASSLSGVEIEGFQLTRSVTSTSGADGITSATVSIGQTMLRRLLIQNQYNGLSLGPTDFSEVLHVICQKNYNHGVYLTNTAADGACQWSFDSVLSQMNAGNGFYFQQIAGPGGVTLGTWKNVATFANSGRGIIILGAVGVPVNDFRLIGGFIGEDGNDEIYLDTYGGSHIITGTFVELAGRRTTGRTLATTASAVGSGVNVTANNTDVHLNAVHSSANSYDGFYLNGTAHALTGCSAKNNGQASSSGRRNGVNTTSGRVVISGGIYGNTGAGTSQLYGAFAADGNNLSIGFADLSSNATAAFSATANATAITSVGNLPNTTNVGLSPQGAVIVGAPTGGFGSAGTVNVSGGLLKNNTAYTNP